MNDSHLYKHCILEFWNNYTTHTVPWPKELWHSWGRMTSVVRIYFCIFICCKSPIICHLQVAYVLQCISECWTSSTPSNPGARSLWVYFVDQDYDLQSTYTKLSCHLPGDTEAFLTLQQFVSGWFVANCKCLIPLCMEFQITASIQY